ncbi:MAG: hypothetical protein ABI548_25290 [Polyangiaceae bacterium]
MTLPDEYLDLSLRSVVAGMVRPHVRGTPCPVSTIVAAVRALAAQVARDDAAQSAKDALWLAEVFESISFDSEPTA